MRNILAGRATRVDLNAKRGATLGPVEAWRARVLSEMDEGSGVLSALVLDELAYRLVLA